jgi:small subunit ribosomal protein S2
MILEQKRNSLNKKNTFSRKGKINSQLVTKKRGLSVGDICNLKITALAPNNIGIDEYSFPYAIFVPISGVSSSSSSSSTQVGLGSEIKAKIVKIQDTSYGVAEFIEEKVQKNPTNVPVNPGDVLTVSLNKELSKGNIGIVELENNYRLVVPLSTEEQNNLTLENVKVQVTRVKSNLGFAKLNLKSDASPTQNRIQNKENENRLGLGLEVGSKFTTTLNNEALSTFTKNNKKFVVLNVNGSIVFLKVRKEIFSNIDLSNASQNTKVRVRIKITSKSENCAVGKILQMNPISSKQKSALVLKNIREMINHGLHFGEKAVKCHARMKNYIWLTTKSNSNTNAKVSKKGNDSLSLSLSLDKTQRMERRPLIKKGRHVINLLKTRRCLNQALNKLTKFALKGRTFLFIGTKKPAAGLVARASFFTKNSFYVNTRWLGGMLTNWKTICKSISKIRPILKEKQKVVREILERRQAIKMRLIKKAFLLRKKSKLILNKGRILLETLRKQKTTTLNAYGNQAKKLTALRNDFIHKGMQYIEKRQKLIQKRRELILQAQTLLLKEKGLELSLKHKATLNQLAIYAKKLREYKYLLILTSEIQTIKEASIDTKNPSLLSVSYTKLKEVLQTKQGISTSNTWILPNPPKEILNKMVLTCLQSSNETQNNSALSLNKDGNVSGSGSALPSSQKVQQKQFIICSTLLSKFSNFASYIKSVIKTLVQSIKTLENQVKAYASQLTQIKSTLQVYLNLKQKYVTELKLLKTKFGKERAIITIVKHKLKSLDAQKKLLKFLPRLRYLPTPQTKISEIVQILLSKIVDPKLKYPIENIYDQKFNSSSLAGGSKKLAAARKKKWQRLEKYFGGISNMTKLTKAQISRNVAIIIGQKEEINAVRECQKLGIKMFSIVDTNCNPILCDHIIPANDDSRSSIKYILTKFITRIRLAQKLRARLVNTIYIK